MLEAVQARMGDDDLFDRQPALLKIDAGAVKARRILRALIAAETAA